MNRMNNRLARAVVVEVGETASSPTIKAERSFSSAECDQLLKVVSELYTLEERGNLPQQVLRSLRGLVPHEFGGCHLIEPTRQHIAACYEPAPTPLPALHKDFWRLAETHPLHPLVFSHPARAWMLSDVISRRAFHATECYEALYRPLQVDCELVAVLPETGTPEAFLHISLHRNGQDFTEHDRAVLNLLLPHIARVRQRLATKALRRLDNEFPTEPGPFRDWLQRHARWELTPRESEVLFWLSQGKTNSEIGRILGIAERTAETHALRIYPKMGVENRYTAIAALTRLSGTV